jgi:hypothetical protein
VQSKYEVRVEQPVLDYLRGVADERNRRDRERGYKHRPGVCGDNAMRQGTIGEYVYCAWAGIDFREHATTHSTGRLLTHDYDKPAPYVLVTLNKVNNDCIIGTLRGWQWLHECNTPDRWDDTLPYPAYATPQSVLHPMHTLEVIYN